MKTKRPVKAAYTRPPEDKKITLEKKDIMDTDVTPNELNLALMDAIYDGYPKKDAENIVNDFKNAEVVS